MRRVSAEDAKAELNRLRSSIDNLDAALVHLLAERFKCTEQVGRLKARAGMPPADPAREAVQIARLRAKSSKYAVANQPAWPEAGLPSTGTRMRCWLVTRASSGVRAA